MMDRQLCGMPQTEIHTCRQSRPDSDTYSTGRWHANTHPGNCQASEALHLIPALAGDFFTSCGNRLPSPQRCLRFNNPRSPGFKDAMIHPLHPLHPISKTQQFCPRFLPSGHTSLRSTILIQHSPDASPAPNQGPDTVGSEPCGVAVDCRT
jgi:hypothetical protein